MSSRTLKYILIILLAVALLPGGFLLTQNDSESASDHRRGSNFRQKAIRRAERKARNTEANTSSNKIHNTIDAWVKEVPATASVVINDLGSSVYASANPDDTHVSASIYKLYVAYELFTNEENLEAYLSNGYTAHQCVEPMIIYSDNECGYLLGNLVGWQDVNEALEEIGIQNTNVDNYFPNGSFNGDKTTTAEDVSIFLDELLTGDLLANQHADEMLQHMLDQQINDRVPAEAPQGFEIAHKTGNLNGTVHDVGYIINGGTTYSFAILTTGWTDETAGAESISRLLSGILEALSKT